MFRKTNFFKSSGTKALRRLNELERSRLAKLCAGLELSYGAVHKNPDSEAIQAALRPVKRILEILYEYFRAPEVIRAWLNSVHPDLGMSPLDAILANMAEAVETMLENAIAGIPS